jgi:hypothetical protein
MKIKKIILNILIVIFKMEKIKVLIDNNYRFQIKLFKMKENQVLKICLMT